MEETYVVLAPFGVVHFNTIKILLYTTIIDWFDWLINKYIQVQSGYEAAFYVQWVSFVMNQIEVNGVLLAVSSLLNVYVAIVTQLCMYMTEHIGFNYPMQHCWMNEKIMRAWGGRGRRGDHVIISHNMSIEAPQLSP